MQPTFFLSNPATSKVDLRDSMYKSCLCRTCANHSVLVFLGLPLCDLKTFFFYIIGIPGYSVPGSPGSPGAPGNAPFLFSIHRHYCTDQNILCY